MFSLDQAPESKEPFQILPPGLYRVKLSWAELLQNKAGNGSYLALTLDVQEPEEMRGMGFVHRPTYKHSNPKAVEIGHAAIGDLLYALGIRSFQHAEDLMRQATGKEFLVESGLEEDATGGHWPRVEGVWTNAGKHRTEKRSLSRDKAKLGENGKPVKPHRQKPQQLEGGFGNGPSNIRPLQSQPSTNRHENLDDVPF